MIVTNHGRRRMHDRIGVTKGVSRKTAEKALNFGITHAEAKGSLKRYMDAVFLQKRNANNMRFYSNSLFVFRGKTLVTVLPVKESICQNLEENVEEEPLKRYLKRIEKSGKAIKKKRELEERIQKEEEEKVSAELVNSINQFANFSHIPFHAESASITQNRAGLLYYSSSASFEITDLHAIQNWLKDHGYCVFLSKV